MSARFIMVGCLALVGSAAATSPAADAPARKYSLILDSEILSVPEKGKGANLKTATRFDYAFKPIAANKIESSVDAIELSMAVDGGPANVTKLSREAFVGPDGAGGSRTIAAASAPPQLKEMLEQFGRPFAVHTIGADGAEVGEPDLKIKSGILYDVTAQATIRLVHVRFPKSENKWVVKSKLPIGQGQFAAGDLTFEKVGTPASDGSVRVKVTGTLKPNGKLGNAMISDGLYEITGLQVYNPKLEDWVSGAYDLKVRLDAVDPNQGKISTSGTMKLVLKTRS